MKKYSRSEIQQLFDRHAFLPLFNPSDAAVCEKVLMAAYRGGVRLFELTNRSSNALDVFKQIIPFAAQHLPDMVIGAGTIMDEKAAAAFHEAGAQFLVSPVIPADVARYCEGHQLFWVPGASTLNEIVHAHALGADMVKIFPANYLGGPGFVEAIKAPCPWIRVMPTGGVDGSEENLQAWFTAGVSCVGIGSQLFKKDLLAAGDFDALEKHTATIVARLQKIRTTK